MATIVEFRTVPRRAEPLPLTAGSSADILIFPGVRYERDVESNAKKPVKSKLRRDTLEIES